MRSGSGLLLVVLLAAACDAGLLPASEPDPIAPAAEQRVATPPPASVSAAAGLAPQDPVVPVPGAPGSFADLVVQVRPAVVNIYTTQVQRVRATLPYSPYLPGRPRTQTRVAQSLGSGFLVDDQGHILTNAHVIEGAASIRVELDDGRELDAEIVGADPLTDIAVIRVAPPDGVAPLVLGDSDAIRVGDWTVAVGNPFGLHSTVTAGILSARSRRDVPVGGSMRYVDFLQTDASINPGNSGGPLLDMTGRVIGINTAINREGQGIGFAIPANMVREILPQLIGGGHVERSWLGVFNDPIDEDIALALNLGEVRGALVIRTVPGGPAELAGLRPGDVIVRFGDQEIGGPDDLKWIASTAGVGSSIPVAIVRAGKELTVAVVMGELPE